MMLNKKINSDKIIKKLMDIWKEDPINNFRTLLRRLDNDYEEFDNMTQKLINKTFTKSLKDDTVSLELKLKDEYDMIQDLPTGKEKIKVDNDNDNDNEDNNQSYNESLEKEEEEKEETKISFTKDVLPYVIPLTCILTIKNSNMDFVKMLNDIKDNPELLDTFDDMCLIWWNKKDLIDLIKDIVSKYFDKSSNTYNISVQFKMSLQSLIDNPKELLELINDCLKPKEIEKKTFGEVFTPMDFINNKMLKDIENYWLNNKNENIWSNEKLTWYDPAAGMGNYPIAIYYKLMDGLKTKIVNDIERKKHIIEKQLYMGELNKKNCFILKQIFNINNEYTLNLYEGDTLNINLNEVFGKPKFDIIIGNPPYNEESVRKGELLPIYDKFIEYYENKYNIMSYIIPSRWFSGGKGLDKFRKYMLNKKNIVFIKQYDNACDIFKKDVEIKGGVNYFLIDYNYDGLCNFNGTNIKLNNFDILVDNKYFSLINKLNAFDNITNIFNGRYFNIETNNKYLSDDDKLIKCYVSQQKGFIKYIDKKQIKHNYDFYKLITPTGCHGAYSGFGNFYILNNNEIHTGSYVHFKIKNMDEATSLLSYLKCKLPNIMLSLRKNSQLISNNTCKWIPLPPLDKVWDDEEVYKYFKLEEDDIKLIKETKINGYNDIKPKNENEPKIIKDGRKQYYLIDNKLYKIKKDKSQGKLCGSYIDNKIIEGINNDINENKVIKKIIVKKNK